MKNKNFTTIIIVIATIILAGVAIFTAIKLYQTRQGTIAPNAPSSRPAAAGGAACGSSCNSDSDCVTGAQDQGITTACINKVCQNKACPGKTIPGAICACSTLNACGQRCGAAQGLCQASSQCGYIAGGTQCAAPGTLGDINNTYCIPTSPTTGYTTGQCTGIATIYLKKPDGSVVGAQPDLLTACGALALASPTPVASTAPTTAPSCQALTFTIASTPTPSPSLTVAPTATPTPVAQCGTTCSTNSDCPSSMVCYVGVCRNPSCTTSSNCICATATPTATPTTVALATPTPATATPTTIAVAQPKATPTLPTAGATAPTILAITGGAILLILGLVLVL